jgi:hypothetical protein
MTFTEEQIINAWNSIVVRAKYGGVEFTSNALIAELTRPQPARPQPEFREGEVFIAESSDFESAIIANGHGYTRLEEILKTKNCRKLRLSEMPIQVLRLRNVVGDSLTLFAYDELSELRDALADFDREIEP